MRLNETRGLILQYLHLDDAHCFDEIHIGIQNNFKHLSVWKSPDDLTEFSPISEEFRSLFFFMMFI